MASFGRSHKHRASADQGSKLATWNVYLFHTDLPKLCNLDNYTEVQELLAYALSEDASYSQNAIDLRNQRVFAIRVGLSTFHRSG